MAVAIPLALLVNAMRIAMTGILLLHFNGMVAYWAKDGRVGVLADEIAGMIAIFIALFLFGIFVWYLSRVFRRVTI
jgi:exosortase/archaeosortase family protein